MKKSVVILILCLLLISFISAESSSYWERNSVIVDEEITAVNLSAVLTSSYGLDMFLNTSNVSYEGNVTMFTLKEYINSTHSNLIKNFTGVINSEGVLNIPLDLSESEIEGIEEKDLYRFYFEDNLTSTTSSYLNVTIQAESSDTESLVNSTLNNLYEQVDDFKELLSDFDLNTKTQIEKQVNLTNIISKLDSIKDELEEADNGSEYDALLDDLELIEVPNSARVSVESNGNILPPLRKEYININALETVVLDESIENEEVYLDYLHNWNFNNIDGSVDYKTIEITTGTNIEVLKFFTMNVNNAGDSGAIIFINEMENIEFDGLMDGPESGYFYKILGSKSQIRFSTSEDITQFDLDYFVSPPMESLKIDEGTFVPEADEGFLPEWLLIVLIFLVLFILFITGFIILQVWYKKRYEVYLFKDKNNLYNVLVFIDKAKKKGMTDPEIEKSLRVHGWEQDQIEYAMKKYRGKQTGIPNIIPIDKVVDSVFHQEQLDPNKGPKIPKVKDMDQNNKDKSKGI